MDTKKAKTKSPEPKKESNPLVKTLAEVEAMTDEEKQSFRNLNGTTINNPQ